MHHQEAWSQQNDEAQIEIANAPKPVELEVQPNDQERRKVGPRRRLDLLVLEKDFGHSRWMFLRVFGAANLGDSELRSTKPPLYEPTTLL